MLRTVLGKALVVVAATALAVTGAAGSAVAGPADVRAFTLYADVVRADLLANAADTAAAAGDNLTCDPQPLVDGRMLNPRVGIVVGEVFGQAEIVAHWKCASLDTGAVYTVTGTITDWYFHGGRYVTDAVGTDSMSATAGVAAVHPYAVLRYPGGHAGLNTWHFARFVGTTTTGRRIVGDSPLFYVAGV